MLGKTHMAVGVVPYFGIAFLSHLGIDLLNRKGERLFFPLKKRFSFGICSSRGLVNQWMFGISSVILVGIFVYLLADIYLL